MLSITGRMLLAVAGLLVAACGGGSGAADAELAQVLVLGGSGQTGTVGEILAQPLMLRLTNSSGQPLPGVALTMTVAPGGGSLFAGTVISEADGVARNRWQLGTVAGEQEVQVRSLDRNGQLRTWALVRATARAGAPDRFQVVSGGQQSAMQAQELADPIRLQVWDVYGNPTPSVVASFGSDQGGTAPDATTDANGVAETRWTLGLPVGTQNLKASAASLPTRIVATATALRAPLSAPVALQKEGSAAPLAATQHQLLPQWLSVRVVDRLSNGVPGIPVAFTSPAPVGDFEPATVTTDADGRADWAGYVHGSGRITVQAQAAGLSSVSFELDIASRGGLLDGTWDLAAPLTLPLGGTIHRLELKDQTWTCSRYFRATWAIYNCGALDRITGEMHLVLAPDSDAIHDLLGSASLSADGRGGASGLRTFTFEGTSIPGASPLPWSAQRRGFVTLPCNRPDALSNEWIRNGC